ncbi:hypothetical protein IWQ57_000251 [Coemansia nantahalensis]|uniref:Uncharacterized protein n=1 Tax=Coemansia nantahalensis TaxID=2789366 RepID=A0ACC1K8N5_9FUNG|nr:hypothetical protein IWQ57_000251 [Coemansia nantahalensis]
MPRRLLDNAEAADDQRLRKAALEALAKVLADGALLGPTQAAAIIPGVASALAQLPGGPTAPDQSMAGGMQRLSLAAELATAPRKPAVLVRAHALKALDSAVLLVYGAAPGPQQQEAAMASVVRWAEQSRAQVESILSDSAPPASDSDGKNEQTKLQRLLWRLAGLRHTEGLRAPLLHCFGRMMLSDPPQVARRLESARWTAIHSTPLDSKHISLLWQLQHMSPDGTGKCPSRDNLALDHSASLSA